MATPLPKLRVKAGETSIGVELFFSFPEIQDEQRTFLNADSVSGATSLNADGINFSQNQYVVIGQPGNIMTEIVQINGVPSATSIPITSTNFAHNRGDIVRFIPYNQISAEMATDAVTFNVVSTFNIRADSTESYLQRTADASTYTYRFRFFNSTTSLYGPYSDTVTGAGYADNTIYSVKERALRQLGEVRSDLITDKDLNDWIQEGRRWLDQNPQIFRWSFREKFNKVAGQMLAGQWRVLIPIDLRDPNTYKNVLSIRIGTQNRPLVYQERVRFNQNYLNVNHSTIATQVASGSTTLQLASTHDFTSSGAVTLANNSVADGLISVTYTGNNLATNTLTGIPASGTGSINRTVLVGTDAWQKAVYGLPTAYTVGGDGYWYFDVPLKVDYDGQDAKTDYYSIIPSISTDDQTFDEPFYDMYVAWLKWKIKQKKANGKLDRDSDPDYKDWIAGGQQLISQETPGARIYFVPDIEGFLSATE